MTPYASGKRWTLYAGDCLDVLAAGLIPGDAAIVSDPPYGIAYRKGTGGKVLSQTTPRVDWGDIEGDAAPFDPSPWLAFPHVCLWGANHFAARLPRGRWLAWNKLGEFEPFGDSFSDVEFGWSNQKGADRIFSLLWKGVRQGEKLDGGRRYHPSQKPLALMAWSIEQAGTPTSRVVVDPYAGSGATGMAALHGGHDFIGCEVDPQHLPTAARRLAQAEADGVQTSLFTGAA